jgi:hypothetical protein
MRYIVSAALHATAAERLDHKFAEGKPQNCRRDRDP